MGQSFALISPSTMKRAVKKAKDNLPATPRKRASVLEKLSRSPNVSAILK